MTARDDLAELSDADLAERAKQTHDKLMTLPRLHPHRDRHILAWRRLIDEMNRRALPEPVS